MMKKTCYPSEITKDLVSNFIKNLRYTIKFDVKIRESSNFKMTFPVKNSLKYVKPQIVRQCFKNTWTVPFTFFSLFPLFISSMEMKTINLEEHKPSNTGRTGKNMEREGLKDLKRKICPRNKTHFASFLERSHCFNKHEAQGDSFEIGC